MENYHKRYYIKNKEKIDKYNRNYYQANKELKKEKYENNKTMIRAKNSYYYYKKKNDMEAFKNKYPERYELLLIGGYFKDWKPLESISTS